MFLTQAVIRQWECWDDSYRVGDWVVMCLSLIWRVANGWRKGGGMRRLMTWQAASSREFTRRSITLLSWLPITFDLCRLLLSGRFPGKGRKLRSAQWSGALLELLFFFIKYESGCEDSFYPVFDRMVSTLQKTFHRFIFITKRRGAVPTKGAELV